MIGAAVNYECGEELTPPAPRPDAPATDAPVQSSFWSTIATRFAQLRAAQPAPELRGEVDENGRFWSQWNQSRENGRQHWADRGTDK